MKKKKARKKKLNPSRVYSNLTRHSGKRSASRIVVKNNDSGQVFRQVFDREAQTESAQDTEQSRSAGMTLKNILIFLFIFFLPTQLGKHYFFDFSYLSGVRVDYLAPTLYLTDIIALALILLNLKSVIKFFLQKKILFLLLLLLLNLLLSQSLPISLYQYGKILELVGLIAVFKQTKISLRLLVSAFLIGGVFQLILATAQFINKHSLQGLFYFFGERPLSLSMPGVAKASLNGIEILRPYGTFSHPNSMAGFYLLVYFLVLSKFRLVSTSFNPSNKLRVNKFQLVSTILLLISSLLILISFSKIAIISFVVLSIIYFWRSRLIKSCKLCFFSRIFILSLLSLLFLQATTDPLTLQKRLQLMKNSFLIISKRPLFGVGLGNHILAQQQFPQKFADFLNQPVHNIFLLFLSEIGAVISLLLLLIFKGELKKFILKSPYIFAVILLTGMFDHYWLTLQQNFLLLGVVLGVL